MGISLKVQPYCTECRDFEPIAWKRIFLGEHITTIRCVQESKCAEMYKHIQEELKKNGETT